MPYQYARSFLVGPKVRKERVAEIRNAFEKTMTDPKFLAEAKKGRLKIAPSRAPIFSLRAGVSGNAGGREGQVLGVVAGK